MPHSLRVRLKNLQRKGELTEKDIDRIFKALEQEPCEDDYQTDMDEAWKQAKREPCDDVISREEEYVLMGKCSVCGRGRVIDGLCSYCGCRMVEPQESEKVNCKSTKCDNCINHNYCDFEPQESEDKK